MQCRVKIRNRRRLNAVIELLCIEAIKDTPDSEKLRYGALECAPGKRLPTLCIEPDGSAKIQVNIDGEPGHFELY